MKQVLEIKNIVTSYGNCKALDDVSITINEAQVLGLLGPNGAGKSTLIKNILDLTANDSGTIEIENISHTNSLARQSVAYLPEKFTFFSFYTVEDVLVFYTKAREVDKKDVKPTVDLVLEKLNITALRRKKINSLSKGQLQRVGIATVLIGNNKIILLDEPFSGLDPIAIIELKKIIIELKGAGKTIIISSHILAEIEKICTDIAIIVKGKVVACESMTYFSSEQNLEEFFFKKVQENG